jgi:hypothetical protein
MDEHDGWMNRFSNLWHAVEEERRFIDSIEPIIGDLDIDLEERSEMPTAEKPEIEAPNDRVEWLERFANLWQASEKDSDIINLLDQTEKTEKKDDKSSHLKLAHKWHSAEPLKEHLGKLFQEGPNQNLPPNEDKVEGKLVNHSINLSPSDEKNDEPVISIEPITETSLKMKASEASEVSAEKTQGEAPLEREEWLERFANLWLACGKNEDLFKEEVKRSKIFSNRDKHSAEVMSESRNGKVVIDDSLLHDSLKNKNQLSDQGTGDKEYSPNPDDLIVFDIDPEIAIKFLTASRGLGS